LAHFQSLSSTTFKTSWGTIPLYNQHVRIEMRSHFLQV
jgi:hypothetical protein